MRMLRFWFQYDARTAMLGFGTGAPLSETLKMLVKIPEGQQTEIFGGARFVFVAAGKRKTSIIFHAIREPIDLAIRLSVSAEGQVLSARSWRVKGAWFPFALLVLLVTKELPSL